MTPEIKKAVDEIYAVYHWEEFHGEEVDIDKEVAGVLERLIQKVQARSRRKTCTWCKRVRKLIDDRRTMCRGCFIELKKPIS